MKQQNQISLSNQGLTTAEGIQAWQDQMSRLLEVIEELGKHFIDTVIRQQDDSAMSEIFLQIARYYDMEPRPQLLEPEMFSQMFTDYVSKINEMISTGSVPLQKIPNTEEAKFLLFFLNFNPANYGKED